MASHGIRGEATAPASYCAVGSLRGTRVASWIFCTTLTFVLVGCASSQPVSLARQIEQLARSNGAEVAVAYHDSASGQSFFRNERIVFHAASTMKVPVMLGLMESVDRGALALDQGVPVKNDFVSILDGSRYSLDPKEDSDPSLYESIGSTLPLEELMRRMIVRSSNLATNVLIDLIGAPRVMTLMKELGANDIKVLRGVEDDKAYHAGMNNVVTAYDLMLVLRRIAERGAISQKASDAMLRILEAQEFNSGIPAGVPAGIRVAHKTGSITKISHDAAIVYPSDASHYVLVILTRGMADGDKAHHLIAEISRAIWNSRSK
ncbi:MAG TPA: serine hydrolase [Thermoanaerobaculia bacterium]|nr:serine hydrolase [Thermoanaerobaculia bacterium]